VTGGDGLMRAARISAGQSKTDPPAGAHRSLLTRLLAPSGPPEERLVERNGAAVMAVPGRYSVSYLLVSGDAAVVVDAGSNADIPGILAALERLGIPEKMILGIIPTHLHMDHIIGIDGLALRTGAPLLPGRASWEAVGGRKRLRFPGALPLLRSLPTILLQGAPGPPAADLLRGPGFGFPWSSNRFKAEIAPPIDHGDPIPGFPGWVVLHTPGHADDEICMFHEEAGFLVAGDMIRNYLGGEWNPLYNDGPLFRRSKERLLELRVETVFPGHGPVLEGREILKRLKTFPFYVP